MPANWFDSSYVGTPPWDIGRPQPQIIRLAESGEIGRRVLDIGCGTGENALHLAAGGYDVAGIDGSPRAIEKAISKARARKLTVRFEVADALDLPAGVTGFDTVVDSGLFHVFSDKERPTLVQSVARALGPGGTYLMMCFSDRQPGDWGPRRVTQAEIRSTFQGAWRIKYIEPSRFATNGGEALAWLASITRTARA